MNDWSRILSEHGPWAWRTAWRLLGNDADASDCLQDAFVAAVEFSRRREVRNWQALLRRLVTTEAMDRLRRRYRQQARLADGVDLGGIPAAEGDPSQAMQARELSESLRRALAELPPIQAAAFGMKFLDDLSYEQIAEAMDVKPNHVGVLIFRAREALRRTLGATRKDAVHHE